MNEQSIRQKLIAMSGVLAALFLAALDQTVINTALPRVTAELGNFELYSWVFTAYMLAATTSVPIFGKLSDIFGRRYLLLGGTAVFLLGSALCGLAPSMQVLVGFRVLQGVGAGAIMSNALTIIGDLFAPAERGKWQGLIGAVFGLASIVGPLVGGYLTDNLSWRWVFYINLPIGILALAVIWLTIPPLKQQIKRSIDYLGAASLLMVTVPLLLAFSWAGQVYAWTSPQVLGMFALAAASLVFFLRVETRAAEPIIPLALFRNPIFALSVLIVFITGLGLFGSIMFIPLFIQGVIGSSATSSGLALTPMMLANVASSTIAGQIISRWGRYRLLSMVGFLLVSAGMALLATLHVGASHEEVVRSMIIMGIGLGITMPLFVLIVQNALPYHLLGVATASIQFFRQIGGTIGVAIMGSLMTFTLKSQLMLGAGAGIESLDKMAGNLGQLEAMLQSGAVALTPEALAVLRGMLAAAIAKVFLVGAIVSSIGFLASFFLKEIPLRQRVDSEASMEASLISPPAD